MTATCLLPIPRHRPNDEARPLVERRRAPADATTWRGPERRHTRPELDVVDFGDVHHHDLETLCVGESR